MITAFWVMKPKDTFCICCTWTKPRASSRLPPTFTLPGKHLSYEGLAPMWADMDHNGVDDVSKPQLLTTTWDLGYMMERDESAPGFFRVVSQADGRRIGQGNRWQHQLAVSPLGPNGETEIVEIRTPHIGGCLPYYRYDATESKLNIVTQAFYYTSHYSGSRNIDLAVAADFDEDGIAELAVQPQSVDGLYGLQRAECGVKIVWKYDLPEGVDSNLGVHCSNETSTLDLLFSTGKTFRRLSFSPSETPLVTNLMSAPRTTHPKSWRYRRG